MNKFSQDVAASEGATEVVDKDSFRLHFEGWLDIKEIESANHKITVNQTMLTGAGVSVSSGNASVNVAGVDTVSQEIDFIELEHMLQLDDSQLARVGMEHEGQVIESAKARIMKDYDAIFWQWYVGGGSVASRAINGKDFVNPHALLSMQSAASLNITQAMPTSYEGWLTLLDTHLGDLQSTGELLGSNLVMVVDPLVRRAMDKLTSDTSSLLLSQRIMQIYGLEMVDEYQLLGTGKFLLFDPNVMSVKFIIGKEPALRQLRSGVTDGWEKSGSAGNNEVYRSCTHAIMGNVMVLRERSMLAVQLS